MTRNGNYVDWKTREIVFLGGFLPLGTNVCCKANLVCSDWEAAWCCWNRASKEKERKLPFHRWESSNFFFSFFKRRSFRANSLDLFVLLLLLFNAGAGGGGPSSSAARRHCAASVKRHHFLYQPHMRAQFYTAASTDNALPPTPRRPLSLWIVHSEWFSITKK